MKQFIVTLFSLALLASCKKDETLSVYHTPSQGPALTSSSSNAVLDSSKKNNVALSFNWTEVSYGINAEITYTLQLDAAGGDFSKPQEVIIGNDTTSATFTHAALNTLALAVGLRSNATGNIDVRVKAQVQQNGISGGVSSIPPVYSAVKSITVTTYPPAEVPVMYLSGDFNSWPTGGAPVADTGFTGAYEGYIYSAVANNKFKILTEKAWTNTYAYATDSTMIATANGAGDNLYTSGVGYFLVKANSKTLKWKATLANWSMVGDAISNDWTTDVPMTYDAAAQVWTATVNIKATGAFKFWANKDWALNYGVTGGRLKINGDNLTAPAGAGTYKVTLNLSNPANYTYSLVKQ